MHPDDAEDLDFDDENMAHLAKHAVTATEVAQVWMNGPVWVPNKKDRTAEWLMLGRTDGGRALFVPVLVDEARSRLRPIGGRSCDRHEVLRWLN